MEIYITAADSRGRHFGNMRRKVNCASRQLSGRRRCQLFYIDKKFEFKLFKHILVVVKKMVAL